MHSILAGEAPLETGDERAVEPLIERLRDEDAEVRRWAAWALGRIGAAAQSLLPRLREVAQSETDEHARRRAQRAIERIEAAVREREEAGGQE